MKNPCCAWPANGANGADGYLQDAVVAQGKIDSRIGEG
jgi:hypothetical protein